MYCVGITSQKEEFSLRHLQAELARIDLLIANAVHRWQLAGQNPTNPFRGLYITPQEADALTQRPLGSNWGDGVTLSSDERELYEVRLAKICGERDHFSQQAQTQSSRLNLSFLKETFGLTEFEADAFLICLAPALDLRYERLYRYLQDDRRAIGWPVVGS